MSKASQLKALIDAFTSGGKKAVESAVKSAGTLSIADMRKVSEKVAKTNPNIYSTADVMYAKLIKRRIKNDKRFSKDQTEQ